MLDVSKSLAVPQRYMSVYVNPRGKYPGGIVEPEDYEKARPIIDALLPTTSIPRPASAQAPRGTQGRRACLGMGGAQAGDGVYVLGAHGEHGYGLPNGESGLRQPQEPPSCSAGPNIRKGYCYTCPRWLADIVPTLCYMTGGLVPEDAEGAPIYQIMEDPTWVK